MPSLSLCMIVKDEENFLETCLNSVKEIVDEIIIVDTGSKDRTKEIAGKFNAKIINFKWIDDFSAARNESLKHSTKEWILVLDADEVISSKDLGRIKELIKNKEVDGYRLLQRNYSSSSKGVSCENDNYLESKGYKSYFLSYLVRLFRNKDYKFQNKVHEVVEDSIEERNGRIVNSNIPIHHSIGEDKNKTDMYLKLEKDQIKLTPNNPKPYYEIAKLYDSKKNYELALEYFKKAIQLLGSRSGLLINKLIYLDTGAVCFRLGRYKEAIDYFDKAIEHDNKNCRSYFYKGLIFHEQNKLQDAVEMYKKSIKRGIRDPVAYANFGDICLKNKDYKEAFVLLSKACELEHPMKDKLQLILNKLRNHVS